MAFQLNSENVADASIAETLSKGVFGKLFGDKGYIPKQLSNRLLKQGLERLTPLRSNRKQKLMNLTEKNFRKQAIIETVFRKQAIIETVNDQLKNIS